MKCAMVILNYKDSDRAMKLALDCSAFEEIEKIVIVDNCSGDDSFEKMKRISSEKIDVIKSEKNGGFSAGNNVGARYLVEKYNPQYMLFANTDTIFPRENIIRCINTMEEHKEIGLLSTRMVSPDGKEEKANWNFATYKSHLLNCFWVHRRRYYLGTKEYTPTYKNVLEYVDIVRGSFMFFRTEALRKADFFDENVFLYAEETIIAKRLDLAGYKVAMITDISYIHNHIEIVKTNSGYNMQKRMMDSAYYYQCTYNHISILQRGLMQVCMFIGRMEQRVIDLIKKGTKNG